MAWLELIQVGDTQQLHGPRHLCGKYLKCPVHPRFATRHQPVEVGATYQGKSGAERNCCDDVGTGHDSRVQVNFGLFSH